MERYTEIYFLSGSNRYFREEGHLLLNAASEKHIQRKLG